MTLKNEIRELEPQQLLQFALESIEANPGLSWDIQDDNGWPLHLDVRREDS